MKAWYVLRTKPHKEMSVYRLLKSRDVTVFYPTVKVDPVNPRSSRIRPYFPGYMFVEANLHEIGQSSLNWLPGSHGLVSFGGEPATVPDQLVEMVKNSAAAWHQAQQDKRTFQAGDRVRIIEGPLTGYEAIFDTELSGQQRVQVLLAYLHNQPKAIKLNRSSIIKVEKK